MTNLIDAATLPPAVEPGGFIDAVGGFLCPGMVR